MKKKIIYQEGLQDCGPACLAMIIDHYKGYASLEDLKEMCLTSKSGTDAYHLIETAKECGFEASGVRVSLEDIHKDNVILPCIVHVTIDNSYNHFMVIEKIDFKNKKVFVKDPAFGRKNYTFLDFEKIFNHFIILLYPIHTIIYQDKFHFISFLKQITYSSKRELKQIIFISIFITIFSIIASFYVQNMIDSVSFSKKYIIGIFIIFLLIYVFKIISDFLRNKILVIMNEKIDINLTYDTFKQIVFLPYCYYHNHTTGEIVSRIHDLEIVRQVISKVALSIFIDLPLTVLASAVMLLMNATLFGIGIAMMICYLVLVFLFRKVFAHHIDSCQNAKALSTSYMVEAIHGFETIKGSNQEQNCIRQFEQKYTTFLEKMVHFDSIFNVQQLFKDFVSSIGYLLIFLVGTLLVKDSKISLGSLLAFQSLLTYFLEPIKSIMDLDMSITQAKNAISKVMNLFHYKNEACLISHKMDGNIVFKNVHYAFKDEIPVLDDVDFTIEKGNKVLLYGESGSGKSTICKILKKYYAIGRDKIYVDNIDINDYAKSDVIYISQNEILFTDTVANNIGNNNIFDIAKICMVDEMVKNMPLGYQTLLEENGFNISGGQKQRIILARGINHPFEILMIDEGLSQVDVNMERIILKRLFQAYPNKTIIFISHRLDNMDIFDQVMHIEKGKMIYNESKNRCIS